MIFFLIIAFFDGMIRMFSFIFIPLFGLSIDLSLSAIALLMAVMYLPFIFSYFFSELSDRLRQMNVIATGLFIGAFSFISLYFIVDKIWIVISILKSGVFAIASKVCYRGSASASSPFDEARIIGTYLAASSPFSTCFK